MIESHEFYYFPFFNWLEANCVHYLSSSRKASKTVGTFGIFAEDKMLPRHQPP
ncbi:MAG TPA: hypothetical protein GXZ87_07915 [Bacteroidales bacterium]|nr:hypothetical protein [Bacteroidales bacterium]